MILEALGVYEIGCRMMRRSGDEDMQILAIDAING